MNEMRGLLKRGLLCVGWDTVFRNIKAFSFFLCAYANAHNELEDEEESEREDERESVYADDANELGNEVSSTKDGNRKSSPDADDTVNRNRTNWVVDFDFVKEEDRANNDDASNSSHDDCFPRLY